MTMIRTGQAVRMPADERTKHDPSAASPPQFQTSAGILSGEFGFATFLLR
jgi:hypothetical protein